MKGKVGSKPDWNGDRLTLRLSTCRLSYAKYTGLRTGVFFPDTRRTHSLTNLDIYHSTQYEKTCYFTINGVKGLHCFDIPGDDQFTEVTTLDLCRLLRVPIPQEVSLYWRAEGDSSIYKVKMDCSERGRRTDARRQSVMDDFLSTWQ